MALVHSLWLRGAVPVALNCFLWPWDVVFGDSCAMLCCGRAVL